MTDYPIAFYNPQAVGSTEQDPNPFSLMSTGLDARMGTQKILVTGGNDVLTFAAILHVLDRAKAAGLTQQFDFQVNGSMMSAFPMSLDQYLNDGWRDVAEGGNIILRHPTFTFTAVTNGLIHPYLSLANPMLSGFEFYAPSTVPVPGSQSAPYLRVEGGEVAFDPLTNSMPYVTWDSLAMEDISSDNPTRLHPLGVEDAILNPEAEALPSYLDMFFSGLIPSSWITKDPSTGEYLCNMRGYEGGWYESASGRDLAGLFGSDESVSDGEMAGAPWPLAELMRGFWGWFTYHNNHTMGSAIIVPVSHCHEFSPVPIVSELRREGVYYNREFSRSSVPFSSRLASWPQSPSFGVSNLFTGLTPAALVSSDHVGEHLPGGTGFYLMSPMFCGADSDVVSINVNPSHGTWTSIWTGPSIYTLSNPRSVDQGCVEWVNPFANGFTGPPPLPIVNLDPIANAAKPFGIARVCIGDADVITIIGTGNGLVPPGQISDWTGLSNVKFENQVLHQSVGTYTEYYDWLSLPVADGVAGHRYVGAYSTTTNGIWYVVRDAYPVEGAKLLSFQERNGAGSLLEADIALGMGPILMSELHSCFVSGNDETIIPRSLRLFGTPIIVGNKCSRGLVIVARHHPTPQ